MSPDAIEARGSVVTWARRRPASRRRPRRRRGWFARKTGVL